MVRLPKPGGKVEGSNRRLANTTIAILESKTTLMLRPIRAILRLRFEQAAQCRRDRSYEQTKLTMPLPRPKHIEQSSSASNSIGHTIITRNCAR